MIGDLFCEIQDEILGEFKIDANEYSPLNLAYIGDAVFEVFVRTIAIRNGNMPVNKLHGFSKKFVNAKAQSKMFEKIRESLTDEEFSVLKRGRNAKSFTSAKNASISDYRQATGLEALFGYLYIKGDNKRLAEVFDMCVKES